MRQRKAGVPFILVTVLIDVLGFGLIIPIVPELVTSFEGGGTSRAAYDLGALLVLFAVMQFLCAPVLGALSDRFGRRPVILLSVLGTAVDYLLLAGAPNLTWLFIGRLIGGVTSANIAAANAYIADISAPEERARRFGMIGAAFGLGFIIGPAMGGLLGDIDLRLPFLVAAGLSGINLLYGLLVLPESLRPENRRPFSWRQANPLGSVGALARHPQVLGLTLAIVGAELAMAALRSVWVLYNGYRYGWSALDNGLSLAAVGLAVAVVQGGLIGTIVSRFGERRAVLWGLAITMAGFILDGLAGQGWMIYAVAVFLALGGMARPAANGLISRQVGADEQGAVQGAIASLLSITMIVAPLVATFLFGHFTGAGAPLEVPGAPFFFGALTLAAGWLCAWRTLARVSPIAPPAP